MPQRCWTIKEVAGRIGITDRLLQMEIKAGKLRAFRGPSKKEGYMIPETQLIIFLNRVAVKNQKAAEFLQEILKEIMPK